MSSQQPFVTQSDRIKALCDEAMRRPDITVTEKTLEIRSEHPASETSRLKVSAMRAAVPAAEKAADEPRVPKPEGESTPEPAPAVEQQHTEQDQDLASMLEERELHLNRKKGRVRLVANVALLLLFVTPVTVVAVTPTLRAKFQKFAKHLGEGMDDVKTMANTKEGFDAALKEVAVRNDQINAATEEMGVDPNSVSADDDLEMTAELQRMMGDEADGFATRRGKLQAMGTVATAVTGMEETKVRKQ